MNAADLPLSFAPFELVAANPDGSLCRMPFTDRAAAEKTAAFLRQRVPSGTFFVNEPTPVLPGLKDLV